MLQLRSLFPILENYEGDWPTHDCLTTHLKNRKDRHTRTPQDDDSELTDMSENDHGATRRKNKVDFLVPAERTKRSKKRIGGGK
jgi:hypothetical protein